MVSNKQKPETPSDDSILKLTDKLKALADGTVSPIEVRRAVQEVCDSAGHDEAKLVILSFLGGLTAMGESARVSRVRKALADL
jgi:hypothetical protein